MSAVGVGLASVGTASGMSGEEEDDRSESRGTVTFAASAVTHSIDFPSEEERRHSLVAVNTLPEHAVFEDEGVLSYTHHTTRETARVLEENPASLWHENYQGLPVSDAGSTQNARIGVNAIDHSRLKHGVLIEGSYRPPGFNVTHRGETVRVTAASEQSEVEPGERFQQELPSRKVAIKVSSRSEGTEDDTASGDGDSSRNNDGGPPHSVEQLTVTPTIHVTNYGEVEIRAPEDWTPREPERPPKEVRQQ